MAIIKLLVFVALIGLGLLYYTSINTKTNNQQEVTSLQDEVNALKSINNDLRDSGSGSTSFSSDVTKFRLQLHSQFQIILESDSSDGDRPGTYLSVGKVLENSSSAQNVVTADGVGKLNLAAKPINGADPNQLVQAEIDAVLRANSSLEIIKLNEVKIR